MTLKPLKGLGHLINIFYVFIIKLLEISLELNVLDFSSRLEKRNVYVFF